MAQRKLMNVVLSVLFISSLLFGNISHVAAAPTVPTDESLVPHYFGPYPNWANSPQVLVDAIVTITPAALDPGSGAEAVATVDPKTGGITGITVTNPGSGYLVPPDVTITAAGVTPTALASATAEISSGVVNSIVVDEAGFGFTAPTVSITGGSPTPGFEATAVASGGVDNLALVDGGSGYTIQPIVEFSLPNLPGGVQATGSAVMDLSGVVTGVQVVNPGSGYTSAPTVTILDGNMPVSAPGVAAQVVATIGVGQVDVTSGGQGYVSAPLVTIADTVGAPDKGASATAAIAALGAVTAIHVTDPGAGYLTPGLKKFVDTLPGLGPTEANNLGQYIPIAVPDTTTYPGADYYEIGLVQYRMKFHSDLPPTLLRGYVQLSTSVVPGNHVPLGNANLDPSLPDTPILLPDGNPAYGVDTPHYMGPTIVATRDKPVRILFRNLLPTGADGNLFIPVDTSLMGSGAGPDMMTLDPDGVPMDMHPDEGTVLDMIRNPMCGELPKPMMCFSENRATLHLHGGITPWISDGTPHQWTTPADEMTAYPQGVSVSNVPDMPDPGPGAITFFYTNQQSARLMFYHDHAWGITRLNVYAGEAAPYLITDDMEQSLIGPGGALEGLGLGTPLVIQDKTFLPSPAKVAEQDPTWQYDRWGGEGNLWVPHVYMPAQNPGDPSGMSAFGRWMYGPWFWPPADAKYPPIANPYYDPACDPNIEPFCEPALIPATPNVSVGMEAFHDTPIVNGAAYPTTTLDPKAYRFRILNAANDRFWNLSWYVADPRTGTLSEVALNPAELEAAQTDPVVFPTPDTTWSPKGPDWIQIGTEGGFLPAPVVLPAQPTTWITDPTRFDVGNVDQHSLLLAPAERADVIVDFSRFRGKTLILYNDAPAAFPARVPGYDYYTGGPDLSPAGAPTTLPGYGPNTRTIMQVKVSNAAPEIAFDRPNTTSDRLGALMAAFEHKPDGSGVFEASQNPIIVGQAAYNSAYGTSFVGTGWCNSPDNPTPNCDGYARIMEQGGDQFKFDTLSGAQVSIPFEPKSIHDEMNSAHFDEWGRMSGNLGLEAPGATPLLQNVILYPYVNPATEIFDASGLPTTMDLTPIATGTDGTQIWKITHNGVDTHPIHWHLYDVQVLNRVTWDNIIIPPDPNELGWKDTVRISPLEDTIVAIRPIIPVLPFGVPDSVRPLNPMMPIGARGAQAGLNGIEAGFNNTDANGNPLPPIVNEMVDFGWEYVFHCHILSHEEMDMMRPVSVHVPSETPDEPVLWFTQGSIILHWTDGTPVDYTDLTTWTNRKNEIGYRIERSVGSGPWVLLATVPANTTSYTDYTATVPGETYNYRVIPFNEFGDTPSLPATVVGPILTPGVELLPDTDAKSGDVGANVTYQLTLKNTGNANDLYTVAVNSPWTASAPATVGPVTPGIDVTFDVSIAIPADAASGASTQATVTVTSGMDDNIQDQSTLTTTANPNYQVSLAPDSLAKAGDAGETVPYNLTVTNGGNATDTFDVVVNSLWTANAPLTIGPLAPGGSAGLDIDITIPAGAADGDSDQADVTVSSQTDPNASAQATLTTTANPFYQVSLAPAVDGKTGDPGVTVGYHLTVTNQSNTPETFDVVVASLWTASAPATVGPLAAGESAGLDIDIAIPADANGGDASQATVSVTSQVTPTVQAQATLTTTTNTLYKLDLAPLAASKPGDPGAVVTYNLTLTNTGNTNDTFSVGINSPWTAGAPALVGPIVPGASMGVDVSITVPADAAGGAVNQAAVTIASQASPAAQAQATLTTIANPRYEVNLTPADAAQSGNTGTSVTYNLSVKNNSNIPDSFTVGINSPWPASAPASIGPLASGASAALIVTVDIPAQAPGGGANQTVVSLTSLADPGVKSQATLTTTALPIHNAILTPTAFSKPGDPGATVAYDLVVNNTGNTSDVFTVSVSSPWTAAAPAVVGPVAPGGSAGLVISITIPADAASGATNLAVVAITSQSNPTVTAEADLTTTANPRYQVDLTPASATKSGNAGTMVIYSLEVTNHGNTADTFEIMLSSVWLAGAPITVGPLAPGATASVYVTVMIPAGAAGGDSNQATVTVRSTGDPAVQIQSFLTTTTNNIPIVQMTYFMPVVNK